MSRCRDPYSELNSMKSRTISFDLSAGVTNRRRFGRVEVPGPRDSGDNAVSKAGPWPSAFTPKFESLPPFTKHQGQDAAAVRDWFRSYADWLSTSTPAALRRDHHRLRLEFGRAPLVVTGGTFGGGTHKGRDHTRTASLRGWPVGHQRWHELRSH